MKIQTLIEDHTRGDLLDIQRWLIEELPDEFTVNLVKNGDTGMIKVKGPRASLITVHPHPKPWASSIDDWYMVGTSHVGKKAEVVKNVIELYYRTAYRKLLRAANFQKDRRSSSGLITTYGKATPSPLHQQGAMITIQSHDNGTIILNPYDVAAKKILPASDAGLDELEQLLKQYPDHPDYK